jgi:hypothetical protein
MARPALVPTISTVCRATARTPPSSSKIRHDDLVVADRQIAQRQLADLGRMLTVQLSSAALVQSPRVGGLPLTVQPAAH